MAAPVLHLVAGPNGAGKSTFVELVLRPVIPRLELVNADEIAKASERRRKPLNAYEAAEVAALRRATLISQHRSFIAETVFSHESKLGLIDDAIAAGYLVHLYVVMVPVATSVARVAERVEDGGHDVPESKIRERHARLWPLVAKAIGRATEAHVYDNSVVHPSLREVAAFEHGHLIGRPDWPRWAPRELKRIKA
jgi:predicted ABC-type ATPase